MSKAEVFAMFHHDPHRVFVGGRLTTPSFNSRGAAEAYAAAINAGTRTPEFKLRAAFTVVQVQMPGHDRVGVVWIADECLKHETMSVTNDAEAVCAALHGIYPNHRIIYRDTEGKWDELVHKAGIFQAFLPARNLAPTGRKILN